MDATNFKSSLVLRSINRNDKFSPLGMDGTKKVNDYLTDNKISLMKIRNYDRESIIKNRRGIW